MQEELELVEETALNLTLKGTVGSFKVGTGLEGQNSLEVKYFLTHVGLDFSVGSDEALLSHLAPVREIFNFEQLDFDEIMQRDIDDARVSSELIPYLLDEKSKDLVKLFPPIVVVVLPVKELENKPANKYPKVSDNVIPAKDGKNGKRIIRSGDIGQEVFEFEQPIFQGKALKHDKVRLRLNTTKTRLVIVDGQHRAMALLALYRNLKDQWSDEKRSPFKEYYSEWTPSYIQQFNLKEINLPVILCTFPSLDEGYEGGYDIKQAARSIFLTLNKTARKVSSSRNILLDDNDIIAVFLRECLSNIKSIDALSPYSLRIFNIELDQSGDKVKVQSPVAISGVNHVYYIIEHLMLNNEDVKGATSRSGKFYKRTDLNTYVCMDRLDGRNLLGSVAADSTTRDNFTTDAADKLRKSFFGHYGVAIIEAFQLFSPYEAHNKAAINLETRLESHEDRTLRPILFEGQGMGRVFEAHRTTLKDKLKGGSFHTDVPKIEAIAKKLDATAGRITSAILAFQQERAELLLANITDKSKLKQGAEFNNKIIAWVNGFYENVLTTVAFQAGFICGFYGEVEKANIELSKKGKPTLDRKECFREYVGQLNKFFIPKSTIQLRKLVSIFSGELDEEISEWKIAKTNFTFRNVVYRGEMQPDQWPKYKYLFLEVWDPSSDVLKSLVKSERDKCRGQIFSSLYSIYKATYCLSKSKTEDNLDKDELNIIFNDAYNSYSVFLKNIGADKLPKGDMNKAVAVIPVADEDRGEDDAGWDSVNGVE